MPSLPFRIMGGGDKARRNVNTYPGNRPTPAPTLPVSTSSQTAPVMTMGRSTAANSGYAGVSHLPGMPQRVGSAGPSRINENNDQSSQDNVHHPTQQLSAMSQPPPPPGNQNQQQHNVSNHCLSLDSSLCTTASAPERERNQILSSGMNSNLLNQPSNPVIRGMNVNPSLAASTGAIPSHTATLPPPASQASSNVNNQGNSVSQGSSVTSNKPGGNPTKPGSYQVTRITTGPAQVYRVTVPAGVRPGTEFNVHAGPRRVRVRCPATSRPGQSLQITLPPEPITNYVQLKSAPLTAASGDGGGGSVKMSVDVGRVNEQAAQAGGSARTYLVTIPPNIYPGMQFTVNVGGQRFMVNCPESAGPNMKVRIVPPVQPEEPEAAPKTQVFEVAVPVGVQPGQPFALVANGQRVLVTCPPNIVAGQKIRFQLPVAEVISNIQLAYESEKGGWKRTVRATDLKFQWVRLDSPGSKDENDKLTKNSDPVKNSDPSQENPSRETDDASASRSLISNGLGGAQVDVDGMSRFDFSRTAYVRKIIFLEGNDARMRTGSIELTPAHEAVVDSRLVVHNRTLLSYSDIAVYQTRPFHDKQLWFESICKQLVSPWDDGHVRICVRRSHLLHDSIDAVMGLGRDDMRKIWRIEFINEPAIDAGGPTREFFELVTEQLFDPACGLWVASINNQACVDINPGSALSCPDDHLVYYRFAGRILGRALFDRQLIKAHLVRMIYKHLLGWPVNIDDIKAQDEEYYQSLKKVMQMEDVSDMCLDFTVTEENMGMRVERELVEGGGEKEVTNSNLQEYLEANIRYRIFQRVGVQLTELLLGFFDVVPEPALTVFDANELELMLCGLPEINLQDWKMNTRYRGLFEMVGLNHQVVKWFWEVVEHDFDQEMRARLLQFATGTSGVPARGFNYLQGSDGNIKLFTIQGVDRNVYMYPKSHTCFNRIDLPNFASKQDLKEKLTVAITTSYVGFDTD